MRLGLMPSRFGSVRAGRGAALASDSLVRGPDRPPDSGSCQFASRHRTAARDGRPANRNTCYIAFAAFEAGNADQAMNRADPATPGGRTRPAHGLRRRRRGVANLRQSPHACTRARVSINAKPRRRIVAADLS